MYESQLLSPSESHDLRQQRNSGSSTQRKCYWMSRRSHLIGFLLSNRVWEASTRSSSTTRYDTSDLSWTGLIDFSQQCKDVEDKLGDLIPWLIKLKDSVTTASADGNHEEATRREQLTRYASYPRYPIDPNQPSADPWKMSRDRLRRCRRKGRRPGSLIKRKTSEQLSSLSRTSDKRF